MIVENLTRLQGKLQALRDRVSPRASVVVGFTQRYAWPVHEYRARHVVGQWRYLEQPSRTLKPELSREIREVAARTGSLEKGLLSAGRRLQREAQLLVPVDTGALKNSAFTCLEREIEQRAQAAFAKSEAIRVSKMQKRKGKTAKRIKARKLRSLKKHMKQMHKKAKKKAKKK